MSETIKVTGSCLCKAVSFKGEVGHREFHACHCGMCRQWGGGPFLSVEAKVQFEGESHITAFASSDWAERGFCGQCGTHLFYRFKGAPQCYISLGVLDNTEDFKFQSQIYVDKKPHYYQFINKTEEMTEAEVLAKFNVN